MFTVGKDHGALKLIFNLADSTSKFSRWRLHVSEYEFPIVHRAGIKKLAANGLLQLEAGVTDTTFLDDSLPEMLVSSIKHVRGEINDDHDGNLGILFVFQKYDRTLETVKSAVQERATTS